MSERSKHLFQFQAEEIARAAGCEAEYHKARLKYWMEEYHKAAQQVRETAKIEFRELAVTGGTRMELAVNYGDVLAYSRMGEAWSKAQVHAKTAETYAMDAHTYASQGSRTYELDGADVLHFRLWGGPREE